MLIVTRGLPGSGKTTHALQQGMTRVNRDGLREMLHGRWIGTEEAEVEVSLAQRGAVEDLLAARVSVYVDDCNLHEGALEYWWAMARKHMHAFLIHDFTGVSVEECIRRAASRTGGVDWERIIRTMHARYFPLPELDESMKRHIRSVHGTSSKEITMTQGYSGEHEAAITTDEAVNPEAGTPAEETATGTTESDAAEDASFGAEQA
jgi:predicted kinase